MTKAYTLMQVEAALVAWEAMLELRDNLPELDAEWEREGTVAMRHKAIEIGSHLTEAWNGLTEEQRSDLIPFDWEFAPAYVRLWFAPTRPAPDVIRIAIEQLVDMGPDEREIELERVTNVPV